MANRWFRFGIALLALAAATAAGYRIFQQDQQLTADLAQTRAAERTASAAIAGLTELKATLYAYVAEGQGYAFWTGRAGVLIDELRAALLQLDAPAAAANASMTEALDLTDRLASAEQRAQEHVRAGQNLLAGDVIFTDARDLIDATTQQIDHARTALVAAAEMRHAQLRQEQIWLALGGAGVLAFATLLLVVPGRAGTPATGAAPADEYDSTARLISRTPVNRTDVSLQHSAEQGEGPKTSTLAARTEGQGVSAGRATPISLKDAAAVCTDLGRASQAIEISALLQRAAKVLNASGAIVWMAAPGGHELYPAAAAGYDERLLARIGALRRDASNVTAAAFREAAPKSSPGLGPSAAALAVPLLTPLGPAGVLSAEVKDVTEVDESLLAVAVIFAAQLATLVGSMTAREEPAAPAQAQA